MRNSRFQFNTQALRSLGLLTCATACFATLDTASKFVTQTVPVILALWFLFLFQALVYAGWVFYSGKHTLIKSAHIKAQITRGTLMIGLQALAMLSLAYLPVGEFTAIAMLTPLLVTLLAGRFLGEKVSLARVGLVLCGFVATLVIVRPNGDMLGWAIIFPLGLLLVNATYQLLTSWMSRTQDTAITLLFTSSISALLITPAAYFTWKPLTDFAPVAGLLLMGTAASCGNMFFVSAFQGVAAASLMPYMYLQIGFGIAGGWLVFNHVPDFWAWVGMAVIACCGIAGGILTQIEGAQQSPDEDGSTHSLP